MIELNGYIKLHRKLVQWGWYTDYVVKDMFLHLLIMASFRETAWMGRVIRPGQLITSRGRLAEELGFSVQQVRTALAKLKSTNEITIETTNKYTIITVVNWDKYQVVDEFSTNTLTSTLTNEQPTKNAIFYEQIVDGLKSLQLLTSTSTSQEELANRINSEISELEKFLATSSATNEQPSNNHQATNNQPHRKNVKNNKNVKKEKNSSSAAEFHRDGFADFLKEGGEEE